MLAHSTLWNSSGCRQYDLSSVSRGLSAAAPLQNSLHQQFNAMMQRFNPHFNLDQAYGLTELSPMSHAQSILVDKKSREKLGSVGMTLCNQTSKIVSAEDERVELGPNQPGEILVKGINVMKGYLNNPEATEATLSRQSDGVWLKSGDIGYYDDDHFFYVIDRSKELIKVKGFQVAPAEIEDALLSHPGVDDCAVIGVPHKTRGEAPKAFIVRRDESVTQQEIAKYISDKMSDTKRLEGGIQFVQQIPKIPSGKILRRKLREINANSR